MYADVCAMPFCVLKTRSRAWILATDMVGLSSVFSSLPPCLLSMWRLHGDEQRLSHRGLHRPRTPVYDLCAKV